MLKVTFEAVGETMKDVQNELQVFLSEGGSATVKTEESPKKRGRRTKAEIQAAKAAEDDESFDDEEEANEDETDDGDSSDSNDDGETEDEENSEDEAEEESEEDDEDSESDDEEEDEAPKTAKKAGTKTDVTLSDVILSLKKHTQKFSREKTAKLLKKKFGVTNPNHFKPKQFAEVIKTFRV